MTPSSKKNQIYLFGLNYLFTIGLRGSMNLIAEFGMFCNILIEALPKNGTLCRMLVDLFTKEKDSISELLVESPRMDARGITANILSGLIEYMFSLEKAQFLAEVQREIIQPTIRGVPTEKFTFLYQLLIQIISQANNLQSEKSGEFFQVLQAFAKLSQEASKALTFLGIVGVILEVFGIATSNKCRTEMSKFGTIALNNKLPPGLDKKAVIIPEEQPSTINDTSQILGGKYEIKLSDSSTIPSVGQSLTPAQFCSSLECLCYILPDFLVNI